MKSTKATKIASVVLAPLAMAAITLAAAAPAMAASPAQVGAFAQERTVTAVAAGSDDSLWDDGEPAGGTGVDPGPQTAPDLPGIPEGYDSSDLGQRAGGTGVDPGPSAPPDTPSGPGDEDGGEPAGAV